MLLLVLKLPFPKSPLIEITAQGLWNFSTILDATIPITPGCQPVEDKTSELISGFSFIFASA